MSVPYTESTAVTQVRALLNEKTTLFWSDQEIKNWIWRACQDISTKTHCVEANYGISLIDGTYEYSAATSDGSAPNVNATDVTISSSTPGLFTSATSATFITDGFKHGMRVNVTNTTSNDATYTIQTVLTELLMTFFESTATEGQGSVDIDYTYDWIEDITKIYGCVYHKGDAVTGDMSYRGLLKVHPRTVQHLTQTGATDGEPYYWYHFGDTIGVWPIPDSAQASDVVLVYHSKVTEDIALLPDMHQAFAIYYAVAQARYKEGNIPEARMWEQMYLNSILFHRQDIYNKGVDSYDMFKIQDRFQPR